MYGCGVILSILGYREGWDLNKVKKPNSSQNALQMYPELLPHQLQPISTYPNPPLSHIGKIESSELFVIRIVPYYSPPLRLGGLS